MMRAYAQSAGYAEQALSAIKVVQSYGQEDLEKINYTKFLDRAAKVQRDAAFSQSGGLSIVYIIMFGFYAYAFFFGGLLRWNEVEAAPGKVYTGGVITTCIFCVVFGAMQLGGCSPHIRSIAEGRIAGRIAFEAIDHVPTIKCNEENSKMVDRNEVKGELQFQNVCFHYPSRPELKVLKDFTCTFEPGKTTALVGPSGSGKSTII